MKKSTLTLLIGLPFGAHAADEKKVTYQDHIRPIFESRCFSCHDPDKKKGGLDLTNYTGTMEGSSGGEIVNAGDPGGSSLIKVTKKEAEPFMPPKGDPLSKEQIDLMSKWIAGGLLETSSSTARKPKKPAFDMKIDVVSTGKPEGPPPMPEHLLLEPVVLTKRASATSALASSPWGPLVALSGQKQVLLYNTDTLRLAGILPFPEGFVESLSFSRNGSILLAGGGRGGKSGRVVGWEVKTGKRVIEVGAEFDTVLASDISADHAYVALGGPSRKVKIFTTADSEEVHSIKKHTDWVTAMAFSHDGILLATGDRNGNLYVWETETGNLFYDLRGHKGAITGISWRGDSNVLASSSEDNSIHLWEMKEGKKVKNWTAHGGGTLAIHFQHDGRFVSCGRDRYTKVWDQSGKQLAAFKDFKEMPLLTAFTHDGKRIVTGDWLGEVSVWGADGKARVGYIHANPPSIDSRIAATQKRVTELEGELGQKRGALEKAVAALNTMKSQNDAAKEALPAKTQDRGAKEGTLKNAKAAAAKAVAARDAAQKDLEAKKADPNAAKPAQDLLNTRNAELTKANEAVAAAQKALDQANKLAAEAQAAVARTDEELKKLLAAEKATRSALDGTNGQLAAARNQLRKWNAAKVNTERFAQQQTIPELEAELEYLVADFKNLAAEKEAASQEIGAATAKVAEARKLVEAREADVVKARERIPSLETKVRLNQVLAENSLNAHKLLVENAKSAADDPEVKAKMEAAVKAAEQAVSSAQNKLNQLKTELEHGVANAEKNVVKAKENLVAAQNNEATKRQAAAAIEKKIQEFEPKKKEAEARLSAAKSEAEALKKRYFDLLAKK